MCNALNDQCPDVRSHIPEAVCRHRLEDVVDRGFKAGGLGVAALYDLLERGNAVTGRLQVIACCCPPDDLLSDSFHVDRLTAIQANSNCKRQQWQSGKLWEV